MNIHKSQLFWCEQKGYKVLTHPHIEVHLNALTYSNDLKCLRQNADSVVLLCEIFPCRFRIFLTKWILASIDPKAWQLEPWLLTSLHVKQIASEPILQGAKTKDSDPAAENFVGWRLHTDLFDPMLRWIVRRYLKYPRSRWFMMILAFRNCPFGTFGNYRHCLLMRSWPMRAAKNCVRISWSWTSFKTCFAHSSGSSSLTSENCATCTGCAGLSQPKGLST